MAGSKRHIAIIAPPTLGHINPLIALADSLAKLGYRSTLVHVADVGRLVDGTALGFEPLGGGADGSRLFERFRARVGDPTGPIGLIRMIRATADVTRLLLEELPAALARIRAEVIIADSVEPAGALVARHLGLPFVTSVTGLPLLREAAVPPPFVGWRYRDDPSGLSRNRNGYAVADLLMRPVERVVAEHRERWGLAADGEDGSPLLQVAQCPALLDFPRTALPAAFRYGSPWRLSEASVARPSDDPRPLVFCSLGTLQGSRKRLFAAITRACAMVGARAIVAHGGGLSDAEAASLPGDPLVRAFWPQRAVLAHCSAAVLHGGFNSVLDALAAGVPIVAVPIAFEQPATAARLDRTGAGVVVRPAIASARRLARALADVLRDPSYRAAARTVGATMAGDGAAAAAALVDAAFTRGRLPPV